MRTPNAPVSGQAGLLPTQSLCQQFAIVANASGGAGFFDCGTRKVSKFNLHKCFLNAFFGAGLVNAQQ